MLNCPQRYNKSNGKQNKKCFFCVGAGENSSLRVSTGFAKQEKGIPIYEDALYKFFLTQIGHWRYEDSSFFEQIFYFTLRLLPV